jgi:hypothetical protein
MALESFESSINQRRFWSFEVTLLAKRQWRAGGHLQNSVSVVLAAIMNKKAIESLLHWLILLPTLGHVFE